MRNPFSKYREKIQARRKEWKSVLDSEINRWSDIPYPQIESEVRRAQECYEVDFDSKKYQVEVAILENTEEYIHIGISVDDGTLPASLRPVSSSVLVYKGEQRPTS